jgi:membrane protease YdiL (CAAX protease family)
MTVIAFLVTFLLAWFVLDRLAVSPPMPLPALVALAAAAAVLVVGERVGFRTPFREVPRALGLGRPVGRALVVATIAGVAVIAGFLGGAALTGTQLQLRADWPLVLVGVLVFHGLAEELVWRGFAFGHLRRRFSFWRAVLASMPLIALTHVTIIAGNGWLVGGLAVITAAVTCLPLSYLYERGGQTMWAPALLHGLIGTWQLFERTYPMTFSLVLVTVPIVVPLVAFAFGAWFFGRPLPARQKQTQHTSTDAT